MLSISASLNEEREYVTATLERLCKEDDVARNEFEDQMNEHLQVIERQRKLEGWSIYETLHEQEFVEYPIDNTSKVMLFLLT